MKVVILWFHTFPHSGLCFIKENNQRVKYWFQKNDENTFDLKELNENDLKYIENERYQYCKNLILPLFHGEKKEKIRINNLRIHKGLFNDNYIKSNIKYKINLDDFVNYLVEI